MTVGCEFFDENGVLVIGLTTRVFKRVGSVSVAPGSSGSVTIPELADANLVGDYIISPTAGTTGVSNYSPDVTFSGQTMSWSFGNYRFQSPGRYLVIEYGFY